MSNTKPDFNSEKNIAKIKAILTKPADQRTSHEIKRLLQPLMADISFSKERKLKPHELNEICLGLEYDHVPKHSYVIHDGDEDGEIFYIILKGRVGVWYKIGLADMKKPIRHF